MCRDIDLSLSINTQNFNCLLLIQVSDLRMVVRTYEDELGYLERINPHCWRIKKGFQPNMNVEVIHISSSMLNILHK